MHERHRFERELADLEVRDYWFPFPRLPIPPATIGFEFDVHYGLNDDLVTAAGRTMPANNALITDHSDASDGFRVKRDGPRLEIATKPFKLDPAGKAEIDDTKKKISEFAAELEKGCKDAAESSAVTGIAGKPRPFTHPRTVVAGLPIVKLPFRGKWPKGTECAVWAAPQATVTIPLSKVGALISEVKRTEGKGVAVALSGHGSMRQGVKSLALYKAKNAVDKIWPALVRANLGITEDLRGLLILLASYLWTSELPYRYPPPGTAAKPGEDYEPFAKAFLPMNVKTPFSAMHREILSDHERAVFRDNFAVGAARVRMFRLAKPGATLSDGSKLLFPTGRKESGKDSVHERQKTEFTTAPTWNDLLAHTIDPSHNGWGERLLVPISKVIAFSNTKPRIALELRRIGWTSVFARQWPGMIDRIVKIAERLNS